MNYVLDAGAMIAYLRAEPGAPVVAGLLLDPSALCFAHALNLCEVYYDFRRAEGEHVAQAALTTLTSLRIASREDMDATFWQDAGRVKADHRHGSIADCFAIALTRRLNGEVVTTDHREFDPLVPLGLCPIRFIR